MGLWSGGKERIGHGQDLKRVVGRRVVWLQSSSAGGYLHRSNHKESQLSSWSLVICKVLKDACRLDLCTEDFQKRNAIL